MTAQTTHTLFVSGTHCSACKHLIEDTLREQEDLRQPTVSLSQETLTVTTTQGELPEELALRLSAILAEFGYGVHTQKPVSSKDPREWLYAIAAVFVAVLAYIGLERAGLTSLINGAEGTLTTAVVVGLVASVSTCLAVVGGLVLSVSATYAHEGKGWRPQVQFHAGRVIGFFLLGGLLGVIGEAMQLGFYGSALLGAVASVIMLILGIHLLDVTKRVKVFTLPKALSDHFTSFAQRAGPATPFLLGAATFFLPCGFTQSMQFTALSSGSFFAGASTMLAFSLGTLPVLALVSFGSLDLAKSRFRGTFFKAAGLLVILFALFNLHNVLVVFGVIRPILSF